MGPSVDVFRETHGHEIVDTVHRWSKYSLLHAPEYVGLTESILVLRVLEYEQSQRTKYCQYLQYLQYRTSKYLEVQGVSTAAVTNPELLPSPEVSAV